jgi:hypothetical protein
MLAGRTYLLISCELLDEVSAYMMVANGNNSEKKLSKFRF